MDIFKAFATDPALENQGQWFPLGDGEFLIARSGNRAYSDMFSQLYQAHKRTLDARATPEERAAAEDRATKITVEVMSKTILLGWRGTAIDNGDGTTTVGKITFNSDEEFPYSVANAAQMLAVKDFRAWVNEKAADFKNFLLQVQEADEKNSVTTSSGS